MQDFGRLAREAHENRLVEDVARGESINARTSELIRHLWPDDRAIPASEVCDVIESCLLTAAFLMVSAVAGGVPKTPRERLAVLEAGEAAFNGANDGYKAVAIDLRDRLSQLRGERS